MTWVQVEWPGIVKDPMRFGIGTRENLNILMNETWVEKMLIGFMGRIKIKKYHSDDQHFKEINPDHIPGP